MNKFAVFGIVVAILMLVIGLGAVVRETRVADRFRVECRKQEGVPYCAHDSECLCLRAGPVIPIHVD